MDEADCELFTFLEVREVRYADGSPVAHYSCQWTFSDGGAASTCNGSRTYASPGYYSAWVKVTDLSSGASTTNPFTDVKVSGAHIVDVVASAPACGLTFSYATSNPYEKPGDQYDVTIQPLDKVLTPTPWGKNGTIEVSVPGTYTVHVYKEASSALLCADSDKAEVTVQACQ
jgi:hypothetical protein